MTDASSTNINIDNKLNDDDEVELKEEADRIKDLQSKSVEHENFKKAIIEYDSSFEFKYKRHYNNYIPKLESISNDIFNSKTRIDTDTYVKVAEASFETYLFGQIIPRKKFFIKSLNYHDLMKWQGSIIEYPLTPIPSEYEQISKQIFKNLMGYMGDLDSKKAPEEHMLKLLKNATTCVESVKDEIFLYCYKQIKDNKNMIMGWKALSIISSSFPASSILIYPLMNQLLLEIEIESNEEVRKYANFVFMRLYKFYMKRRKYTPSYFEISFIENLKPITLNVHLFNGEYVTVTIESYTTIRELKSKVLNVIFQEEASLEINLSYGIYEVSYLSGELTTGFIEDSEYVMDIFSIWSFQFKTNPNKSNFKFYLKRLLFFEEQLFDNNSTLINLLYCDLSFDYLHGKYNISNNEDLRILSSLKVISDNLLNQSSENYLEIVKNPSSYIPSKYLNLMSIEQWADNIMEFMMNFSKNSEAKRLFIEKIRENPLYNSNLFDVTFPTKYENPLGLDDTVIYKLGINPESIELYNDDDQIFSIDIKKIVNWGISSGLIAFVVSEKLGDNHEKYYFSTRKGKIIQYLLEFYANRRCNLNMKEIEKKLLSIDNRFDKIFSSKDIVS